MQNRQWWDSSFHVSPAPFIVNFFFFPRSGNLILLTGESICSQRMWNPAVWPTSVNSDRVSGSSVQTPGRMHQIHIYPKTCVFYSWFKFLHTENISSCWMFGRNYQCVMWHCKALFGPRQEGAGNCFPQSLRTIIPSECCAARGPTVTSEVAAARVGGRQECVCLANLALFTPDWKSGKKGPGVSPLRQLDLLNHFTEPRRRWPSGLGFRKGWRWGGGASGDGVRLEFSRGFGADVIVAQTVIMVDELTRFYLREESCSLH